MRACLPKAATDGGETVEHRPVLLSEILSWLRPASCSTIIDCTIGPGGHASGSWRPSVPRAPRRDRP